MTRTMWHSAWTARKAARTTEIGPLAALQRRRAALAGEIARQREELAGLVAQLSGARDEREREVARLAQAVGFWGMYGAAPLVGGPAAPALGMVAGGERLSPN